MRLNLSRVSGVSVSTGDGSSNFPPAVQTADLEGNSADPHLSSPTSPNGFQLHKRKLVWISLGLSLLAVMRFLLPLIYPALGNTIARVNQYSPWIVGAFLFYVIYQQAHMRQLEKHLSHRDCRR